MTATSPSSPFSKNVLPITRRANGRLSWRLRSRSFTVASAKVQLPAAADCRARTQQRKTSGRYGWSVLTERLRQLIHRVGYRL
ncbi:TPA: hypothetical protein HIQ31_003389 [Escherichia coli]|nr:hypothetical protein [Escherichia coli]HBM9993642.1 hypothetical protein [Escherichia coli]HBN0037249.1 hypothetical protein [Escherichia coli]HBN0159872.1 hypothetical protein [Escherichia coli]HBN0178437.1 hypothetical protein [Escherichia coli]